MSAWVHGGDCTFCDRAGFVIRPGRSVLLDSARGPVTLVVVKSYRNAIRVCSREEFERSRRENRRPRHAIGFHKYDVIEYGPVERTGSGT